MLRVILFCFILLSLLFVYFSCAPSQTRVVLQEEVQLVPDTIYGFSDDKHWFENRIIKNNQFMADFFQGYGVAYHKIIEIEKLADSTLSLRKIKAGKEITCIRKGECKNPDLFIYQPDDYSYVVYSLGDSVYTDKIEIPHFSCLESASGVIETSLWDAMVNKNMSVALIDKMEDALAAFDFTTSQVGDEFKLIYDEVYVDEKAKGIGQLYAAFYKTGIDTFIGVYFENKKYEGFYNEGGHPTKRAFLNAPIRASYRISSGFNLRRFHPIDKRVKAHRGTDYAAPYGTPIRAVADGKVIIAGYTKGNGKYVKIRHNKTYQTQYLHMQGYASGVRSGRHVKQGQTIGYVGSTGKATGPHVCFRFWKNGRQIDHRRENFPPLAPMPKEQLPKYLNRFEEMSQYLAKIECAHPIVDLSAVY
ncbi:MAG: peptidoglycan DD-metalloendopeptidase family protein [Saprospiraceae bacterium]